MFWNQKPEAVIFDFDGTLADSMWVWDEVDSEFARRRNLVFDKDDAETIAALGFEGTAAWLLERFDLDETVDDLIAEWYELARDKYARDVRLKPGAVELISRLRQAGTPVAIATSLRRDLLEPALANNGMADVFDAVVVCEEVCATGKSTPAVYLETARLLGKDLARCAVFEDVAMAARSAKSAGAFVVGMRDDYPQQVRGDLIEVSDLFIDGFCDLL